MRMRAGTDGTVLHDHRDYPSRLDSLTSLRFFAALLVFGSHIFTSIWYQGQDPQTDVVTGLVLRLSVAGVEFFFLLSGFVLTWSARDVDRPAAFWRRRAAKILPNHVVTWIAGLVLLLVTGSQVTWLQGASTLALVDAWIPNQTVQNGVNPVSWSLGCEAFFYLLFPLLLVALNRIRADRLWWWVGGCFAVIAAIPYLGAALLPGEPKWAGLDVTFLQHWLAYTFPVTRLFEFLLGMLLARIVSTGRWYPRRFATALIILPVVVAVSMPFPYPYGTAALLVIPLALLVLAATRSDIRAEPTFLARPAWVWLGSVSFAFYMVHLLVIMYIYPHLDPDGTAGAGVKAAASVGFLIVSLIAAWILYSVVEKPAMRRFGGSSRARAEQPERSVEKVTAS